MKVPYVHSNFARIEGDYYPTIDKRCTWAFLEHFKPTGFAIDPCAPDGSGIVDALNECGVAAGCRADAFDGPWFVEWIVSNPPYKRGEVDSIIYRQIERIAKGEVDGVAMLLRSNFDFAKSRVPMFAQNEYYYGQIKMLFRPWWSEDHSAQPIHNYVWHIWRKSHKYFMGKYPITLYSEGKQP